MKKNFQAGDFVLVHGKWSGHVVGPARKKNQWVVTFDKKGDIITGTIPATQVAPWVDSVPEFEPLAQAA